MKEYKIIITSIENIEVNRQISACLIDDDLKMITGCEIKVTPIAIQSTLISNAFYSLWVEDYRDISNINSIAGLVTPLSLKHRQGLLPFSSAGLPKALADEKKYNLSDDAINSLYQCVRHLDNKPDELLDTTYEALKRFRLPGKTIQSYASLILQIAFYHFLMPFWSTVENNKKLLKMLSAISNKSLLLCWKRPMLLASRFKVMTGHDAYKLAVKMNAFNVSSDYKEHVIALAIDVLISVEKKRGSIFYPVDDLTVIICKYFYTFDSVKSVLLSIENSDIFSIVEFKNTEYIARKSECDKEKYIISTLQRIASNRNSRVNLICSNTKLLNKFLLSEDVILDKEQQRAFELLLTSPVCLLSGDPGTGKTFISTLFVRYIEQCLSISSEDILLLSPTGIVSQRLSKSSGMQAKTLHRAMGIYMDEETNTLVITELDEFKAKVILIDESSMPNLDVFNSFCKCLPNDCKIILVGDSEQLPSIGNGKIFSDLIKSKMFPHAHLVGSRRANGSLDQNAKKIIHSPDHLDFIKDEHSNQIVKNSNNSISIATKDIIKNHLLDKGGSASSLIVLSPWHKESLGTVSINNYIQELLIKRGSVDKSHKYKNNRYMFFIGDLVLVSMTDYKRDIYNGDTGIVTRIASNLRQKKVIHVSIRGRDISFTKGQAEYLDLAYSMTPHKIQGSEVDNIIITIPSDSHFMLSREWLLTAMTRAKKQCVVISTPLALEKICQKSSKDKRISYVDLRGNNEKHQH